MYIQRNIEECLCNHCCSGKAVSITYSQRVSVALRIQHAMRLRHVVICGLSGSTALSHIFEKIIEQKKVCFDFLNNFYLKHFSL
jgi:hypothetical protein